ncbi:uncharacterized protein isoform X2 [Rhodnius prolixus]|uniref:uncharacterized protein isoform X2 n=1 Tax=Rhodnius prolixus TaxID=13249 RepID=UPI003D18E5F5
MSNCDTADYLNRDVPIEYDTSEREYNKVLGHSDNEEIQQHWALVSIFEDGSVLTLEDSFGKCILEMSSASSCCFPKVPAEYDGTGRKAQFYLYTKPVQNAVLGHSDNEEMHHWALVAVFEDQSVRTLEGTQSDGKLVPVFTKEKPAVVLESKMYNHISLETSPAAKAISLDLAKAVENHKTAGELPSHKIAAMYLSATTNSSEDLCS